MSFSFKTTRKIWTKIIRLKYIVECFPFLFDIKHCVRHFSHALFYAIVSQMWQEYSLQRDKTISVYFFVLCLSLNFEEMSPQNSYASSHNAVSNWKSSSQLLLAYCNAPCGLWRNDSWVFCWCWCNYGSWMCLWIRWYVRWLWINSRLLFCDEWRWVLTRMTKILAPSVKGCLLGETARLLHEISEWKHMMNNIKICNTE